MKKQKPNYKVVIASLIALYFMYLTFFVDWIFIIVPAVIMYLNHKELFNKK